MKRACKRFLLSCVNSAGLPKLRGIARKRNQELLILGYHGVSLADEHLWDRPLYIPPSGLEARLALLQRTQCAVLPLAEAVQRLYAGSLPPRSVVLTFDDGFYDFYREAFPLLRRYDCPATVYLTTYYCDYNKPVFDIALGYLLWKGAARVLDAHGLPGCEGHPLVDLRRAAERNAFAARLRDATRGGRLSGAAKDELLDQIAGRLGLDYHAVFAGRRLHLMNPPEVAEIAAAGIDVQLHTHHHRTPIDRDLFRQQIALNRDRVRAITGRGPRHFCYPSGFYVPELLPWLQELNIASATTSDPGLASEASGPLLLPRFLDSANICQAEFEAWLHGIGPYFSRTALKTACAR